MPIPKIQGPILPEMIPDSTPAIRFPVPTIIWCETNRNQSVALQPQKIPERAVRALVWLCGLSRRTGGLIWLGESGPRRRCGNVRWGADGHCLEKLDRLFLRRPETPPGRLVTP